MNSEVNRKAVFLKHNLSEWDSPINVCQSPRSKLMQFEQRVFSCQCGTYNRYFIRKVIFYGFIWRQKQRATWKSQVPQDIRRVGKYANIRLKSHSNEQELHHQKLSEECFVKKEWLRSWCRIAKVICFLFTVLNQRLWGLKWISATSAIFPVLH